MSLLIRLVIITLGVIVAENLVSGVSIDSTSTAIVVAIVFVLLNTFIKPIFQILALPLTLLTLGLFSLVINVGIVYLVDFFVGGFEVAGFFSALFFSIVVSLTTSLLGLFLD